MSPDLSHCLSFETSPLPIKRIQRKRVKGWRMPNNTVSVCRPHKWGNPFKVGLNCLNSKEAVLLYEIGLKENTLDVSIEDIKKTLRGRNLACFCSLNEPCHADILLKIANAPD